MHTSISKHLRHALTLTLFALAFFLGTVHANTPQIVNCDGYPCVNFSHWEDNWPMSA